ncbi:MAG: right-handed parallel beta-helix repeat-containing protein [Nanoarchaeota archaeon]|nr:right-handed parallel beta-helix repeat-containing protein [Nanoarchaeota archaeon]
MKNKKGELGAAIALAAVVIIGLGALFFTNVEPQITGMAVAGGVAGAAISSCGVNISESSVLTQNVSPIVSPCITINGSNLVFDCQGYTISGGNPAILVANQTNVTIKNCIIESATTGILAHYHANNSVFRDNTFRNIQTGIRLAGAAGAYWNHTTNNLIVNNTFISASSYGVNIYGPNNSIINNSFSYNKWAIMFSSTDTGLAEGNYLVNNTIAIYLSGSKNVVVDNNTVENSTTYGIYNYHTDGCCNNVTNNTLDNNKDGIYFSSTAYSLMENNLVLNSRRRGIHVDWPNNTIIRTTSLNSGSEDLYAYQGTGFLTIIDSVIGSYGITSVNLTMENSTYGKIVYLNNVSGYGTSLVGLVDSDIRFGDNFVFVNSSGQSGFNVSANVTMYGLPYASINDFNIIRDVEDDGFFEICPSDVCQNISYSGGTLVFNVTQFTTYSSRGNTPPNVTIIELTPSPAYTNDTLYVNVSYFDEDADTGAVFFNWTVDNTQVNFLNYSSVASNTFIVDTLDSGNFSKNQNVTVYVWAWDGYNYSTVKSDSIIISNTLPTVPMMNLSPSPTAYHNQDLYCNVTVNSTDADGNLVNYTYLWYNNSVLVSSTGPTYQLYDVLIAGNTTVGDTWNCTIIPSDDVENGTSNSSITTIVNDPPSDITFITPANYSYVSPQPLFNWTNSSDFENDTFTYYLEVANEASFTILVINISTLDTNYTDASSLPDGVYYWRVNTCDNYDCNNYSSQPAGNKFYVDTTPPNSTITTITNNSDIGVNSFPINISGTAQDNIVLGQTWVNINSTFYNASDPNPYAWNYSWTPDSDGEFVIYSMAIDSAGINETLFEYFYVEVYTTSNITDSNKTNSNNTYSEVFSSVEIDSDINLSTITISEFIQMRSYNCIISGSHLNYSTCDNSVVVDCSGEYWTIDPSNLDNVMGSNNIFTDSNASNSRIDDSNVTNSYINYTNMTSSVVNDSVIYSSNITESVVAYSTVNESNVTNSVINNSVVVQSTVESSNLFDVNVTNSTISNSNLTNVTIVNSNVQDMVLNNTVINNDQCSSGTIVYQGTTYNCPINLNTIYSPPPPAQPPSGGGGQPSLQQCRDGKDNDGDGLIDYPADPGCVSSYDIDESEETCTQGWVCTSWSDCRNGKQTRSCTDGNNCEARLAAGYVERVIETEKPPEEVGCAIESCEDGIQNQGETGVDCGGPCPPCPSAVIECTKVADCPEGYSCVDNICVEIPERQPVVPEVTFGERLSEFFGKTGEFFGIVLDLNERINKKIAEWLKIAWGYSKELLGDAFDWSKKVLGEAFDLYMDLSAGLRDLVKDSTGKTVDFVKANYGSTLIVILSIAVIIAGYFAYQSFAHSSKLEEFKKSRGEKVKTREKEKVIQQKKEAQEVSKELSYFIRDSLLGGYQIEQIKDALVAKGWPKKVVDKYTKKIKETHKEELKTAKKIRGLKEEEQRIEGSIEKPKKGIKFWERPKIPKTVIFDEPIIIKTKPVKETRATKLLSKELDELEQQLKKPTIRWYQKPKVLRKEAGVMETSQEKLKEKVAELIKKDWSRSEIIEILKKDDWPEDSIKKYLDENFPELKNISKFKKEVAELDETLKRLGRY